MRWIAICALAGFISTIALADESAVNPELTAAQIIEKNADARGGKEAWRKIQTIVWLGHVKNSGTPEMPYALELKRPNKTRFEIKAQNQKFIRIFDGINGWKIKPSSDGRPQLQPYSAEDLSAAKDGVGMDGMLADYEAEAATVTLAGIDEIEGRNAYRLSVNLPSGTSHQVWIDAKTFLDVKYDREIRNAHGESGTVSVFYRDYRTTEGLQLPFVIESGTGTTDKMVIDKIILNPPLDEQAFAKPSMPGRRNTVTVDIDRSQERRFNDPSLMPEHSKLPSRVPPSSSGSQ